MADLEWTAEPEELREPILLAAWQGWNDAAESATNAVRFLRDRWAVTSLARIDHENFYDFTQARPTVRLAGGTQRALDWPQNEFWVSHEPLLRRDFVLFVGLEPHLHWRAYLAAFGELLDRLKVATVVTLGGLIADSTHTRPVPVAGYSTDPGLAERLLEIGARSTNYEGPTGIVGVMGDFARRTDRKAAGLWASVPPYISGSAYPKASHALLTRLNDLLDLEVDLADLESSAERVDAQIQQAVDRNPEVAEYIRRLERLADESQRQSEQRPSSEPLSSEGLFEELEDFLKRSRRPEDDDPR
jgi:proteasome assembly chaperone (PAC2) family protein